MQTILSRFTECMIGRSPFALFLLATSLQGGEAEALFARRVWPLLEEKCLACHGKDPGKIKSDYDMRTRASTLKGGESGVTAILPGKPDESPFYLAVTRAHEEDWKPMPPKENDRLSAEQIAWIKEWIAAGVPWPDEAKRQEIAQTSDKWAAEEGMVVRTSGGLSGEWTNRRYKPESLWGYQPVRKPTIQSPKSRNPIDDLIAMRIPTGAEPAPPADARTFIRRATFDLTGLPPKPDETESFVSAYAKDPAAAVDALVSRLMDSPHYGERMARHWLDVVRYADSSGFANDYERGNAWRYRDYVIRSFNVDKPYDRFIKEQIAGDEIEPGNPEMLVATGFLRMGPWELTGMEVAKVARQRFLDDVTNSIGETFLSHSLQCARCHDHKFDPVPTQDYYSIQAVFATTQLAERPAPFLREENTAGFDEREHLEARRAAHLATLAELDDKLLSNAQKWLAEKKMGPARWNAAVEQARKQAKAGGRNPRREFKDVFAAARAILTKQGVPEDQFPPKLVGFEPADYGNERVARKGLERLQWELERYEPVAFSVYNGRTPDLKAVYAPMRMPDDRMTRGELEQTAVLPGGDPFSPAAQVKPGVLSVIPAFVPGCSAQISESIEGRRKSLADWVADPRNPLTTRSIVNRIWMWHFGTPIAGNPNNFGSTGKKPTHPELLEWLAATFVDGGWSFKRMHRLIMTSAAYQRSTAFEASGSKLSREQAEQAYLVFKPRRLTAEEFRDTMLAVSGELNPKLGGIPNRPEINLEAALQPRMVMGTFAAAWQPNPLPSQRHRRSLYALKIRGLRDPLMEVLNEPAPDFSCEQRDASTVTPQVFAMFNSQASFERAIALANRVLKESPATADETVLDRIFRLALNRPARSDEMTECVRHWRAMTAKHQTLTFGAPVYPKQVRREAVEENTGEKFSFDEKLTVYDDFIPDLQPADVDARTRGLAEICLVLFNSNEFVYVY